MALLAKLFVLFSIMTVLLFNLSAGIRRPRDTSGHHLTDGDKLRQIAEKIDHEEKTQEYWRHTAKTWLDDKVATKLNTNRAKNVIMFLGDGMSVTTLTAARIYLGQKEGEFGESNTLSFEKFPITGLSRTYCVDRQVADSACTATAYLGGVKTNYGTIGVNANITRGECEDHFNRDVQVDSIGVWALDAEKDVGFVTTTRVTHASPAGIFAHTANRDWESDADFPDDQNSTNCWDIARQLILSDPGQKFKVIMGGGRGEFLPNITTNEGRRLDGVDLIKAWKDDKENKNVSFAYVEDVNELRAAAITNPDFILGLFHDTHMDYRLLANDTQPTLEEMTEVAIKSLAKNKNGYFLFIEGGRIDHAHHDSQAHLALEETVEFSKAVDTAIKLTNPEDTLIVVTSDHSHVMTMAGYPSRGNNILTTGDMENALDDLPYLTLSYANGPGYRKEIDGQRFDPTHDDNFTSGDVRFAYPSLVPTEDETHGGEDVAVFAYGPWQHLFAGSYEQHVIPHIMAYAMCLNNERSDHCIDICDNASSVSLPSSILVGFLVLLLRLLT